MTRVYRAVCYSVSRVALLYGIGFVGNLGVPRSIDHALPVPIDKAVVVNLVLLGLFAFQQGVMADPAFRQWWTGLVAPAVERSTYVLFGSLALFLLYWQWRAMPAVVWNVLSAPARLTLTGLCWLGWAIVVAGAVIVKSAADNAIPPGGKRFRTRVWYWPVRHPIMSGFLVAFWATPVMTAGHLLFAIAATGYIVTVAAEQRKAGCCQCSRRLRHVRRARETRVGRTTAGCRSCSPAQRQSP